MRVIAIKYPVVIMEDGKGFLVNSFEKQPVIGASYKLKDGKLIITGNSIDSDCVSGVCPIK